MGVPAFFRWLSNKYSTIVVNCVEEKPKEDNGVKIPVDTSKPNPNNVEFDNLYLDMNGIIHPCCHPENKPAPKNEDEMMVLIFEYIDRIFSVVRPRKLLYMAIDGVAPRAKMNQQRSRRFRAAQEAQEKVADIARIKAELRSKGAIVPEPKEPAEHFDSNCITPGTPFMDRLAKCLRYYVHDRLNNDLGWKNIKVILSDANVPGEGEHKIMDYIRRQRASPGHDPNTHHCLCGADADLIMLGLATHEPNFTIIREEFKPNQPRPCEICGQLGHEMKECTGLAKEKQGEFDDLEKPFAAEVEFIFLRLNILREYLERELELPGLPFTYVFERAIDDWVFMCFFVGNDFLPHLPSLEIRENAIDRLVTIYKQTVVKTGGYLTDSGVVNLSRVQMVMQELGKAEDVIFKMRQENEISFRQRMKDKKKREKLMKEGGQKPAWMTGGQYKPSPISKNPNPIDSPRQTAYEMRKQSMSTQEAAVALTSLKDNAPRGQKRKHDDSDSDEEPEDNVRLWEDGWKERYYKNKFDVALDDVAFRYQVGAAYVEGLCWVLRYYYQGCASWKWFFPYHYAPFASDFVEIGNLKNDFEKGTVPFNPMEQLMGVFPAASGGHVPPTWSVLMADPDSEIIDFYPETFKIDLNGKKFAWQGVALLPFVDEKRLLRALAKVYPDLTPEEKKRNTRGFDRLFVGKYNASHDFLEGLYEGVQLEKAIEIDPKLTDGMSGTVWLDEYAIMTGGTVRSPVPGLPELHSNQVMSVQFKDPQFTDNFLFKAERLPGAKEPMHVLTSQDFQKASRGGARGGFRGGFKPQIGFSTNRQHASLDVSGHRTLSHHMNTSGNGRGNYSSHGSQSSGYGQNQGGYRGQSNQQQGLLGRYGNQQQGLMGQYQDRNKAQNIRGDSRMYNQQSYQYPNNDRNSRGGYQNRQNDNSNRYNANQSSGRYPPPPRRNPY